MAITKIDWINDCVVDFIDKIREEPFSVNYATTISKIAVRNRLDPNLIHKEILKRLERL